MKKLMAVICIFVLLVTFCGCRETEEETSVVSWVEGENINNTESSDLGNSGGENLSSNSSISNPLGVNLNGATITVYQTGYSFSVESKSTKTDRAKINMLNKLQKSLNCKIKVITTDEDKLKTLATTSAASGKALSHIISPSMYNSGYYIASNIATNLKKVSSMDLSKDYMQRYGVLNATRFGNGAYAVPAQGKERTSVVFFNKRIISEIGHSASYVYGLVESGNWTYNEYRNLAKKAMKDLDGKSGFTTADQWGQMLQDGPTKTSSDLLASYGTSLITLNSKGQLVYNMTDSKVISAINLGKGFMVDDGTAYREKSTWQERINYFVAGKSLFLYADIGHADMLISMKDDFGVLPVPQVSARKTYSSVIDYNCRVMIIPAGLSAKDQYNAGAVIQAYEYLLGDVYGEMDKEYSNRYFNDSESVQNWKKAESGMTSLPEQVYKNINTTVSEGTYRIVWDVIEGKTDSPNTAIEKSKSSVQKALSDLNKNIKDK